MAATQFFPASEAIAVNGKQVVGPRFEDLNVVNMVWANAKTWTNNNSVNVPVFEIFYQETNTLQVSSYLFARGTTQTISVLLAIIAAQASSQNFTLYPNWIAINRKEIGVAKDIIINDSFVTRRWYRQDLDQTDISVGVRQALEDIKLTVMGNQGKAYGYYYAY